MDMKIKNCLRHKTIRLGKEKKKHIKNKINS